MGQKHEVKINRVLKIETSLAASLRTYFAAHHMQYAAQHAKEAATIEEKGKQGSLSDAEKLKHDGYVIASIFSAIASLEANINEVFCDSHEMSAGKKAKDKKVIPPELATKLSRMWDLGIPRTAYYSILSKYQIALSLTDKPVFDKGTNPFQDVFLFIRIRNAFMHYEPESIVVYSSDKNRPVEVQDLEKDLKSKFELNPLTREGNPFFPHKCLGYGCCKWGIESSMNFIDEFYKQIGIKNKYDSIRSDLQLPDVPSV